MELAPLLIDGYSLAPLRFVFSRLQDGAVRQFGQVCFCLRPPAEYVSVRSNVAACDERTSNERQHAILLFPYQAANVIVTLNPTLLLVQSPQVMRARYGLNGATVRSLDDIADHFRLSRERVRQIELRALHKLRQPYRNYRVRDYRVDNLLLQAGFIRADPEAVAAAAAVVANAEAESRSAEIAFERAKRGLPPLEEQLMRESEPESLGVRSELRSRQNSAGTGELHESRESRRQRLRRARIHAGTHHGIADQLDDDCVRLSQSRSNDFVGPPSRAEREQRRKSLCEKPRGGIEKGCTDEQTLLDTLERLELLREAPHKAAFEYVDFDNAEGLSDDLSADLSDIEDDFSDFAESESEFEDVEDFEDYFEDDFDDSVLTKRELEEARAPAKTLARLRSEMESRPMSLGGRMSTVNVSHLQFA